LKIQVHDKSFVPFIPAEEIQDKVKELATKLEKEYADKKPLFVVILNGSFIFAADLFRCLRIPAEVCFIKLASYKGTQSTGHVITSIGLDADVHDRHVILLEDIIDTGKTLHSFLPQLINQQPKSLKIVALLQKPDAKQYEVPIDYLGFSIPDKFVVGYGLDYDGFGRNLPAIYQLDT
jgi:hypoxanthine phosphoribosyltransferase